LLTEGGAFRLEGREKNGDCESNKKSNLLKKSGNISYQKRKKEAVKTYEKKGESFPGALPLPSFKSIFTNPRRKKKGLDRQLGKKKRRKTKEDIDVHPVGGKRLAFHLGSRLGEKFRAPCTKRKKKTKNKPRTREGEKSRPP